MTGNCVISLSYLILSSEGLHYSFRKGSESKQRSRERKRDTVWHQPILNSFPLAQFSAAWVLAALFPKANFCTVVRAQELLLHKKLPLGHAAAAAECSTTHRKIDCAFSLLSRNPKSESDLELIQCCCIPNRSKKWLLTTNAAAAALAVY